MARPTTRALGARSTRKIESSFSPVRANTVNMSATGAEVIQVFCRRASSAAALLGAVVIEKVAAGVRLGHADRADDLAPQRRAEQTLAHVARGEAMDEVRAHQRLHRAGRGDRQLPRASSSTASR